MEIQDKLNYAAEVVCKFFSEQPETIRKRSRKKEYVRVRQIGMKATYIAFADEIGGSLKRVGIAFGRPDHTTVIHAIQAIEADIDTEKLHGRISYTEHIVECLIDIIKYELWLINHIPEEPVKLKVPVTSFNILSKNDIYTYAEI